MAEAFSWAAAADVGLGAVGGIANGISSIAKGRVASAVAAAQNSVRVGQNNERRANGNLAATIRGINTSRVLDQGAAAISAATANAARTQDSFTRGNFEQTVKNAEAYGASSSHAAAAGIGGASIQAISAQVLMTADRAQQARTEQQGDVTYDQLHALTGIMPEAVSRIDLSPSTPHFDRSINSTPSQPDVWGSLLNGLITKKDSLHTLLGSFGKSDETNAVGGTIYPAGNPVSQSTVTGTDLKPFAFSGATPYPVGQSTVNGTALAPISIT